MPVEGGVSAQGSSISNGGHVTAVVDLFSFFLNSAFIYRRKHTSVLRRGAPERAFCTYDVHW